MCLAYMERLVHPFHLGTLPRPWVKGIADALNSRKEVEKMEREDVMTAARAARLLGVDRGQLYYALDRYGERRFARAEVRLVTLDECRTALSHVAKPANEREEQAT